MSKSFQDLKAKSVSGELLAQYARQIRYNLGTHKKTRLKKAGIENSRSLLHDEISKKHADKLFLELKRRADLIGKDADKRLRFLTILHSVVDPTVEDIKPEVEQLTIHFKDILGSMQLWSRGTIELEMVNLDILQRISKARDDEARKLYVLSSLIPSREYQGLLIPEDTTKSKILVHCHVVVDLGSDPEEKNKKLFAKAKRVWKKSSYQVDIKQLFKNKTTAKNLRKIADYVTKGGNENLRYNAGFGRDLAEDLEAKIWRDGLGRSDKGGETIEDERGLTVGEVQQLDELYCWLMKRRSDRRGYLLATSNLR
jgi:hypothetical protein